MQRQEKPRLSQLENLVMAVVWDHGQATAELVRRKLEPRQVLKESTVRTLLRRLEAKGYVKHTTEGRTYVYSSTSAPNNVAADAVRSIIDRFCKGSVENLLVGMVNTEVVSPERLQELAQRIAGQTSAITKRGNTGARTRRQGK
jgi:BlaI family penicillinase repressor